MKLICFSLKGHITFDSIYAIFFLYLLKQKKRYKVLIKVAVQDGESIDKALKRFKKKYEKAGILKEFRKRSFFVKPSIKKRMKLSKAIRRTKRTLAEEAS